MSVERKKKKTTNTKSDVLLGGFYIYIFFNFFVGQKRPNGKN